MSLQFSPKMRWIAIFFSVTNLFTSYSGASKVVINNNGPVIFGSNITFIAVLESGGILDLEYDWIFEDNYIPPKSISIKGKKEVNITVKYDKPGDYRMKLEVKYFFWTVADSGSSFRIAASIPGNLEVLQGGIIIPSDRYISSKNETFLMTKIYDPTGFFDQAFMNYMWFVNSVQLPYKKGPDVVNNFTYGDQTVLVSLTAYHQIFGYREGSFSTIVKVRDPIDYINITGRTLLTRGDIFDVNVECGGSGPWSYCWKPILYENDTELYCDDKLTTNDCTFRIIYFYQTTGRYKMFINITNDVGEKDSIIDVTIFNVLPEPQLETVIIPVVCSLLAIAIIVVGLFYFIQTRHRFTVEVADFDFTLSDTLTYRTFCEQLKDALSNAMPSSTTAVFHRGWNFLDCRIEPDGESLVDSLDDDSMLGESSSKESLAQFPGDR